MKGIGKNPWTQLKTKPMNIGKIRKIEIFRIFSNKITHTEKVSLI